MAKRMLAIFTIIAALTINLAVGANQASAARASVDMVDACLYQYQGAFRADVVLVENNVWGWKCYLNGIVVPTHLMLDINVDAWCRHKYPNGKGKYDDFNNPYSWYCEY